MFCGLADSDLGAAKTNVMAPSIQKAPTITDPGSGLEQGQLEPILTLVKHAVEQGEFVPDPIIPLQIEPSRACFERARSEWM